MCMNAKLPRHGDEDMLVAHLTADTAHVACAVQSQEREAARRAEVIRGEPGTIPAPGFARVPS